MKVCKTCQQEKPLSEYNRHLLTKDRLFGTCKMCCYERERKRLATPEGKAVRDAYLKTRIQQDRERKRSYKNPIKERNQAKWAVSNAIKTGKLQKMPCIMCGVEKVEAHHPSYSPEMFLNVVWLCKKHHSEIHKKYHLLS